MDDKKLKFKANDTGLINKNKNLKNVLGKAYYVSLFALGFILSPLSWWNDLFVNIPLAYIFSLPFSMISRSLFLPSFVLGYFLTNILGFLLMHHGISRGLLSKKIIKRDLKRDIIISLIYTVIIILLVVMGILKSPMEYLARFR